jgi:hypothetical protein
MFQLSKDPYRYWWPVTIRKPGDGGKQIDHKVECQFELEAESEVDDIRAAISRHTDPEFISARLKDWRGFQDHDGTELPCNDANKRKFLANYFVHIAVGGAFIRSLSGIEEKN